MRLLIHNFSNLFTENHIARIHSYIDDIFGGHNDYNIAYFIILTNINCQYY